MKNISHLIEILFITVSLHDYFLVVILLTLFTDFNFELLINIHTAKFSKMNCTFSLNNYKSIRSLN